MYEKQLVECDECNGLGVVEGQTDEGDYSQIGMFRCLECEGSGEVYIYVEDYEAEEQD
jgi:DnaJ-class molecular chaperone